MSRSFRRMPLRARHDLVKVLTQRGLSTDPICPDCQQPYPAEQHALHKRQLCAGAPASTLKVSE